jgi:MoxR-like ATPase
MSNPGFWFRPEESAAVVPRGSFSGDRRDYAPVYVYNDDLLIQAVNVAGATGRPLLIGGPSGCGKSSLALHIAHCMEWPVYFMPITSRTQAADLLYTIDHLSRLRDAEAKELGPFANYIKPGVLWEAFDPQGAASRAPSPLEPAGEDANELKLPEPGPLNGSVVLLDEIDKADPDVPNNLLVPLGSYEFVVNELHNARVQARRFPFVVLTTNNERKLPAAFLRRCIQVSVKLPDAELLKSVARAHYPAMPQETIDAIVRLLTDAKGKNTSGVSIAEFLDTVRACHSLKIDPTSPDWDWLKQLTATKPGSRRDAT